ncbi:RluA family pseudouridine synthase [Pontibacillus salipaludis]|uniref:Pseudouridine synthase n=1 Tax=Pontibacillus salipaludis TaxID=1697394 RepID=A0ABQ1Q1R6_9BACI|nr:RluA family pseudouridine synthase [Pontibacillus salipaludis]GGD09015.1 pseudouridine synthase [Pontibacillus salipaludis]
MAKKGPTPRKKKGPLFTFDVHETTELLPFLMDSIKSKSRNSIKSFLTRGQVVVNDEPVTKHSTVIKKGQTVKVLKTPAPSKVTFSGLKILHEDDDIIVIDKDSGLLSMASDKEKEQTAYKQLTEHVKREQLKNRVFIVHRLDRDTSGIMVYAKNEEAKLKLQDNWKDMVKERTYVALVEGYVKKPEGKIESWLKGTKTFLMYSSQRKNDGKHAVTHYKKLKGNKYFSLMELELETGRKNQIRVHMQDIGHPIVGDKKYGATSNQIGRLGLHAKALVFEHPTSGKVLKFETKIPQAFQKALQK